MTMRHFFLLLLPCIKVCGVQGASDFRICAFNLQHFGESKTKKQDVMQMYAKIITRCDVSLLQEVRDNKEKALPQLLEHINNYDRNHAYKAVASERLGRSETYQEQYVFVYRADTVSVTGQYQYPDTRPGNVDAFSREPFVVRFKAPKTGLSKRSRGKLRLFQDKSLSWLMPEKTDTTVRESTSCACVFRIWSRDRFGVYIIQKNVQ